MVGILRYGMIYLGSGLMAWNIFRYARFIRHIQKKGQWEQERFFLYFTLFLLVMFLVGYLVVGVFGNPDLVMSSILFFGSVFVAVMLELLQRITARIQANEHLEAKLMAVEESNRAKTSFLSRMSHEIRTPMNAIIGLCTLALNEKDLPDKVREYLEKMMGSASHLLLLINDILDMSRIESGYMEKKEEPFSLRRLLGEVNGMIQGQCDAKGLCYQCQIEGELRGLYFGDGVKLKQILINVLGNSVKYTPVPGCVSFTVKALEEEEGRLPLVFVVEDTGIGMEKEFMEKLFEPFSQEDESNKTSYGGTGLGLSITKSLLDLLDGEVQVESTKGVGSCFTIRVSFGPAAEEEGEAEENRQENAGYSWMKGLTILVAEDMPINAEIIQDLLEREGIHSRLAENGKVAVDLFAGSEPGFFAAILMDMRMPVMDGVTATRAIRSMDRPDAKRIPIAALTANAYESDVQQCRQAGMDAHLTKPLELEKVMETLGSLIMERKGEAQDN